MEIKFRTKKLEKICTNYKEAKKELGEECARLVHQRVQELQAIDTVQEMVRFGIGRCHPLIGDRQNQYALDLKHPYRLIFIEIIKEDNTVKIIDIVDYH